jgi:hypothetical protein
MDHVLQAFLDPLGDLDFAFAGQELDRAHLAHVHAHRVGGAAEFGVEVDAAASALLVDVVGGDGRRRLGHQQRLGVGGHVVDLDPHVVDHADDALDLLGVEDVVGQVIVDFGVGEVAALLAEHDQVLQPGLARLCFGPATTRACATPRCRFLPLRTLPSASAFSVRLADSSPRSHPATA